MRAEVIAGMSSSMSARVARVLLERRAAQILHGRLAIEYPDGVTRTFGPRDGRPVAHLQIRDDTFYRRVLLDGEVGLGEAYMARLWHSDDPATLMEVAARNRDQLDFVHSPLSALSRWRLRRMHQHNRNTKPQANANIHEHFGVGTEFFRLVLDQETMTYSCGIFADPADSLADAQRNKYRIICEKAGLTASDHVLDIGSGWGQLATYAAGTYGCRVTGITILDYQLGAARQRLEAAGVSHLVDLQLRDYRDVRGRFDKIVSIEMLEHVGKEYFGTFFQVCDALLRPGGRLVVQVISVPERSYAARYDGLSFMEKYIFPGGCLPSISALEQALARTSLHMVHVEDIGAHYAKTLRTWRSNLLSNVAQVREIGYDDQFIRMWDYYLASGEGFFRAKTMADVQLVFEKPV